MKKLLFLFAFLLSWILSWSQNDSRLPGYGYEADRMRVLQSLQIPSFPGDPKSNRKDSLLPQIGVKQSSPTALQLYDPVAKTWAEISAGVPADSMALFWRKLGTPGTDPSIHYLGPTDSVGLRFKVNGREAGYISRNGVSASGIVVNYVGGYTSYGQLSGHNLTPKVVAGTETGSANTLYGAGAGMWLSNTADTTAGTTSSENVMIGIGAGMWTQKRSFVTGTGRNVFVGESTCWGCLTPGENTAVGAFPLEAGIRPTKNTAIGSNALRTGNSALGMTSVGAYASAYSGCIVSSVTINSSSSDWTTATATFSAPYNGGSPGACYATATGTVQISGGQIVGVTIDNPGCGYTNITGTYYPGYTNYFPIVTITGDGSAVSATVVVSCAENSVAVGHTAGWFSRAPKQNIYIGYNSEPTTRYWDEHVINIGTESGIDGSVNPLTKIWDAGSLGRRAKVGASRTFAIGGIDTNYLKVVINGPTGDSTFTVKNATGTNGGAWIYGGLRVDGEGRIDSARLVTNGSYTGAFPDTTNPVTTGQTNLVYGIYAGETWASSRAFNTAIGYRSQRYANESHNTTVGTMTGQYLTAFGNTVMGSSAMARMSNSSAYCNTLIGAFSGYNWQAAGTNGVLCRGVTAVGYGTMSGTLNGGEWSTFYGTYAGGAVNGGSNNTGIGAFTMGGGGFGASSFIGAFTPNFTGVQNATLGNFTMVSPTTASYNYAGGANGLRSITTGNLNSVTGYSSGYGLTTGNQNTFLGDSSGYDFTYGDFNVILGGYKGSGLIGKSRNLVLADGEGNIKAMSDSTNALQIGNGVTPAATTSILDIVSTTRGVLLPRMSGAQMGAISSPATGLLIYNTDSLAFCFYNGSAWIKVGSGAGGGGGSGTVNTGAANKIAYYPAGGTTVDDYAQVEVGLSNNNMKITAGAAGDLPLNITAHASQSARLFEIKNSGGSDLFYITSSGVGNYMGYRGAFGEYLGVSGTDIAIGDPFGLGTYVGLQSSQAYGFKLRDNAGRTYTLFEFDNGTNPRFSPDARISEFQGTDVASGSTLTLGAGNIFEITGTTQINLITSTGWRNGSVIKLLLPSGITLKHNQTSSGSDIKLLLDGGADLVTAAASLIELGLSEFGGTQAWRQIGKVVTY